MFSPSIISSRSNGTCLMFKNLNQATIFLVMHFFFPRSSARFFIHLRHLLMNSDLIMTFFRMLFDICKLAISLWIIIFFFFVFNVLLMFFSHFLFCNINGRRNNEHEYSMELRKQREKSVHKLVNGRERDRKSEKQIKRPALY